MLFQLVCSIFIFLSKLTFSDESQAFRAGIFSSFLKLTGRCLATHEFVSFFILIHKLQSFIVEQCRIKFENMSDQEQSVVCTYFQPNRGAPFTTSYSLHGLTGSIEEFNLIRHGAIELRVNVVPEFALSRSRHNCDFDQGNY